MQNAVGIGTVAPSCERRDGDQAIVSDLVSLIERVEASVRLIEAAIAKETCFGDQETAGNVVVLDDVVVVDVEVVVVVVADWHTEMLTVVPLFTWAPEAGG